MVGRVCFDQLGDELSEGALLRGSSRIGLPENLAPGLMSQQ